MTVEEFAKNKKKAQFCIMCKIPVKIDMWDLHGEFIPLRMILYWSEKDQDWKYEIELKDMNAKSSIITVPLEDVEFPSEGGGKRLGNKQSDEDSRS